MKYKILANGVKMPIFGLGIYNAEESKCEEIICLAINKYGYRMIDTAQVYFNEEAVGNALQKINVKRKDIFITTKVWISNYGYNNTMFSINKSLKKLQTNYIDLVLIHQPYGDYYGAWKALEVLYKKGVIRAIGVSNFEADRLVDICLNAEIKPAVNQIELHPLRQRLTDIEWANKYDVAIESWASLGRMADEIVKNSILMDLSNKYQKTVSQIILKFLVEQDIIVIPKTVTESRLKENIDIFDFEISWEDIQKIKNLNQEKTLFHYHNNPNTVEDIHSKFPELKR